MEKEIKKRVYAVLFYLEDVGIEEDDIYRLTGFNIDDIKTKEDFNEVIRMLGLWYYGLDKFKF